MISTAPTTVVAHRLIGTPTHLTDARTGKAFDRETYSRMKFGDARAAATLGIKLGEALAATAPHLITDDSPLVLPVAYLAVPPACYYLATATLRTLDAHRSAAGLPPGQIIQIHKGSVTRTDYAAASAQERATELNRIDFTLTEDLTGCHVVVIDDVRVTGLAEAAILRVIADSQPRTVTLGYVATIEDPALKGTPGVESLLNHHTVTAMTQMIPAIESGNFHLTIRFLKHALAANAQDQHQIFQACPAALLEDMLAGALANGPDFTQWYAPGITALNRALRARKIQ